MSLILLLFLTSLLQN